MLAHLTAAMRSVCVLAGRTNKRPNKQLPDVYDLTIRHKLGESSVDVTQYSNAGVCLVKPLRIVEYSSSGLMARACTCWHVAVQVQSQASLLQQPDRSTNVDKVA